MEKGKISKKILSTVLVALLLVSSVSTIAQALVETFAEDSFYSAFQKTDPAPLLTQYEAQNTHGQGVTWTEFVGDYPLKVNSYSHEGNGSTESPNMLVDDNTGTKWCSVNQGVLPAWFVFDAGQAITPANYYITGANDDMSNSSRVLHTWQLQASNTNDGTDWVDIDTQSQVSWSVNWQRQTFEISNTQSYRYYRLYITRRGTGTGVTTNGTIQFSGFGFFDSIATLGTDAETDYLYPQIVAGPSVIWDSGAPTGTGWNGKNTVALTGTATAEDAKSYTVLYEDLDIQVHDNTKLSYMISPEGLSTTASSNTYDYTYMSHHMAIDLVFTDGTRLKDLGATDQYGYELSPYGQGQSKVLATCMWNYVLSEIGAVADGKTIDKILVGFEKPDSTVDSKTKAFFDDIKIYRESIDLDAIELADFVDIRQGTNVGSHAAGALMPMAATPNPFNMWVPSTNRSGANKYAYNNSGLKAITISHVASRHMGERGSYSFMADSTTVPSGTETEINTAVTNAVNNSNGLFKHENEIAHNYHYAVTFNEDDERVPGVTVEVTPTEHAAVLRFTFPEGAAARNIMFNSPDSTDSGYSSMTPVGSGQIFNASMCHSDGTTGVTPDTSTGSQGMKRMYVYGEFSATPSNFYIPESTNTRSMASFPELNNGPNGETIIELRVATSFMSEAQAKHNMDLEMEPTDKFDDVCAKTKELWNDILGQIVIEDEDANYSRLSDFYTKLARSHLYPTILSENTGTNAAPVWKYTSPYRGTNANPVINDGYMIYNEGWWDTYRSKWSLLTFLRPEGSGLLLDGIVEHYVDNGDRSGGFAVPRWINPAGNNMMVGTSSDVIIADAYARGVDFNYELGYESALKSASVFSSSTNNGGRNGMHRSIFLGYTAYGTAAQGGGGGQLDTSWALEGYLNDGGQAKMAKGMRDEYTEGSAEWIKLNDEYLYFENRSKYFVNIFSNVKGGWFRNKNANGTWTETDAAFNPLTWGTGYCEDNMYPYSVLAPQDGQGLANLYGGKAGLTEKLDDIFTNNGEYVSGGYGGWIHEGVEKREVKLGQVGMSNQPAYHIPYMYLYSDAPWKTQKYAREIMQRIFSGETIGRGYIGEEDNGSTASWYVWSALGLYTLDQGSGQVVIGSPIFKKVTITTDAGDSYTITANNNSNENVYIQSAKLNGQDYNKLYLESTDFVDGMELVLEMGSEPSTWGTAEDSAPPSLTEGDGEEYTPDILMDATKGVSVVSAMPEATQETDAAYVTNATTTNAAYLYNDNSSSGTGTSGSTAQNCTFTATTASITNYIAKGTKVEMYTLTSSSTSGTDPKTWTLSGSNDGSSWTVLDTRTDETFKWRRYTRPFAIAPEKQGVYKYYQLDVTAVSGTANLLLAEYELLADQYSSYDKSQLEAKITEAEAINGALYGAPTYKALLAVIASGKALVADDDATGKQIASAIAAIDSAINNLIAIRDAKELIQAESYNEASSGIKAETTSGAYRDSVSYGSVGNIGGSADGAYMCYKYVDFGDRFENNFTAFEVWYANNTNDCVGASLTVRLDSVDGPIIAEIDLPTTYTGNLWTYYEKAIGTLLQDVYGIHDVYVICNTPGNHCANIDDFLFTQTASDLADVVARAEAFIASGGLSNFVETSTGDFTDAVAAAKALLASGTSTTEQEDAAKQAIIDGYNKMIGNDWVTLATQTKSNDIVTVSGTIENNTGEEGDVYLIAALYDARGAMVLCDTKELVVGDSIQGFSFNLDLSSAPTGTSIKVFTWEQDTYVPLTDIPVNLTVN